MAVPKFKTSKSRSRRRRSANMRKVVPCVQECKNCGQVRLRHRVCPHCGSYRSLSVLNRAL